MKMDAAGRTVAGGFVRRLLMFQAFVGLVAYVTVALISPWSLMIQASHFAALGIALVQIASFGVVLTAVLSWWTLRRHRGVFRAVAMDPDAIEPRHIGSLASIPVATTVQFILVGLLGAVLLAVPAMRPMEIDESRALSLSTLTFTIVAAASVVHYVVMREVTLRLVELGPSIAVSQWLEQQAVRLAPRYRVTRKILLAVMVPVALVGVSAVLVSHAHLRAFVERERTTTALVLARTVLEPQLASVGDSGRDEAVAALAAHGFLARVEEGESKSPQGTLVQAQRLSNGQFQVITALDEGRAVMRYTAELGSQMIVSGIVVAMIAALLAALFGQWLGRALAADLVLATSRVSELGTQSLLRRRVVLTDVARFRTVAALGGSVESLAERFRVFAGAQERALEAKARDRRMKQLLFASVSHDLKSPLNAVLGFTELVREKQLSTAQLESLDMVANRGRELLAIIETILDAARIEAGQLKIQPRRVGTQQFVRDAIEKAFDLYGDRTPDVIVQAQPGIPALLVDLSYASRAVAVLISHAMSSPSGAQNRAVRIRSSLPSEKGMSRPTNRMMCLHVEFVARADRPSVLEAELSGRSAGGARRSMMLQLSLARSVIELHGGRVDVHRGTMGAAIVTCWLPVA